jgi:hypothetical protein
MRLGQKNGCVRQWAKRGSRPRQPADQRYESVYVFGAVCPERDTGAALVLPYADTFAMQQHLNEIAKRVALGAHGIVFLDNAGWHKAKKLKWPDNLSPLFLLPGCPELNAQENIWQYLRQTYLAVRGLHRHSRRLPGRLAKTSRRDRPHNLNRTTRLDHHRSISLKAGINVRNSLIFEMGIIPQPLNALRYRKSDCLSHASSPARGSGRALHW